MKTAYSVTMLGLILLVAGCATSSKVQEMIDASHRDYRATSKAHEASINVLKRSSVKALKQNEGQADALVSLQKQVDAAMAQLKVTLGNAEAAKVMSAANTVKVAELDEAMQANKEAITETGEKMDSIDHLFEEVMIGHYEKIAESATAAIAALQVDDVAPENGAPTGLAGSIEIVAPDTSVPASTVFENVESP